MNPKYHLLVAIAALSLGACSTDDTCTEPEIGGYKISFTVAEDSETRTTLTSGDFLRWMHTDHVGIYTVGQNVNSNILTTADVSKSPVEFVGTLKQQVSLGDQLYAYYPYDAAQSDDPATVKLSIPAEQTQREAGVYNGESHPLVALPMEFQWERDNYDYHIRSVRFRQLGAIVELQLYSSDEALCSESIYSVTFESDGAPLAGDFSFDLTTINEQPIERPISGNESKMVTTSLENLAAIPATSGKTARVYLTIAPGEYMGQIVVKTDVAQYTFRLAKPMVFERAVIMGLPADLAKAKREILSNIHFEDPEVERICIENWDTNNDGELSHKEMAVVTSIGSQFQSNKLIRSFNELQYFTGLKSIEERAFMNCSSLTSINLPNGVTEIKYETFQGCSSLTSIHLPNGVTAIGGGTFEGCESLESINIPNGVTSIEGGAFSDCIRLTSIDIPQTVSYIGEGVFGGCFSLSAFYGKYASEDHRCLILGGALLAFAQAGLTEYAIPDGVTAIKNCVFYNCDALKSITIPNGVISIGYRAFENCSGLTSIAIPEKVTAIENMAFSHCSNLTSINLPDGLTTIGAGAFRECVSLTDVNLPDGLTTIGASAFEDCWSLTNITIPDGVTTIEYMVFEGCSSLTSIHIPETVTTIGFEAFSECSSLTSITIPNGVTEIAFGTFQGCSSLTSINIPDGVTKIGQDAFKYCRNLTSINIPQTVSSIGERVFQSCSSLSAFEGKYASADHRCLIQDGTLLAFAPADLTEYTILDGVTAIGNYAFYSCKNLTSIIIPNGVTEIGKYAFQSCSGLTSVYCKPATPPTLGYDAFSDTSSSMQIYVPVTSVDTYKTTENWSTYASQIVADNN